jgi:hypothetical protein
MLYRLDYPEAKVRLPAGRNIFFSTAHGFDMGAYMVYYETGTGDYLP